MTASYIFQELGATQWRAIAHTHWQHTQEYADFQRELGRTVSQIGITDSQTSAMLGYILLVHYSLGYGLQIADAPYSPVWRTEPTDDLLNELADYLHSHASAHDLLGLRLELPWHHARYKRAPYSNETSFGQAQGEVLLDITPDTDTLLAQCSKSTRRNIKKSQRNNLQIEYAHGHKMLAYRDDFIRLNEATAREHQTTTHTPAHFRTLFDVISQNENNFVAVVRDAQDVIHAINIMTVFGTHAYCPYGASTRDGKRKLGAYYFIKWEIIRYLKSQGIARFNWGGVSINADDNALSGLNQFKLGFGGHIIKHPTRYDLPVSWRYYLYSCRSIFKHYLK
jgi:lipid II:glycine glycyltransferase (peptidoglycan interpeptide bridge formation enzyme)